VFAKSGIVESYREEAKGAKVLFTGFTGVLRDFAVQIPTLDGRERDFADTLRGGFQPVANFRILGYPYEACDATTQEALR